MFWFFRYFVIIIILSAYSSLVKLVLYSLNSTFLLIMSSPRTGSSSHRHRHHHRAPKKHSKTTKKPKTKNNRPLELDEHEALCLATDSVIRKCIASDEHLSYLPSDCTLEELQGEIALARGLATTIYVKRDGLSTLKVVLSQQDPTVANLKRAIERTANLQQQRSSKNISSSDRGKETVTTKSSRRDTPSRRRSGGDLVAAASTRAERPHRAKPSWRFLWRAYALAEAQVSGEQSSAITPIPDADGRQLLSDFGIGHKSVLRFVKRENYFGRRRQRS